MYHYWLNRWKEKGLITNDQAESIKAFEEEQEGAKGKRKSATGKSWNPFIVLSVIASLFLVGSLLTFVASNWSEMSFELKLGLLIMLMVGTTVTSITTRAKNIWISRVTYGFSQGFMLGSMVVLGQEYPIFSVSAVVPLALFMSLFVYTHNLKDKTDEKVGMVIWTIFAFFYSMQIPLIETQYLILIGVLYLSRRKELYNQTFRVALNSGLFLWSSMKLFEGHLLSDVIPYLVLSTLIITFNKQLKLFVLLIATYVASMYLVGEIKVDETFEMYETLALLAIQAILYAATILRVKGHLKLMSVLFLGTAYVLVGTLSDGNWFTISMMMLIGLVIQLSLLFRHQLNEVAKRILLAVASNGLFTSVIVAYEWEFVKEDRGCWYLLSVGVTAALLAFGANKERKLMSEWIKLTLVAILSLPFVYESIDVSVANIALIVAFLIAVSSVAYELRKGEGNEKLPILTILYYFVLTYILIFNSFQSKSLYFLVGSIVLFVIAFLAKKTITAKGEK